MTPTARPSPSAKAPESDVSSGADVARISDPALLDDTSLPEPAALDAFLAMESDLRTLRGTLAAFRIFACSPEPIDPAAIAVLTNLASEAEQRLTHLWRAQTNVPP